MSDHDDFGLRDLIAKNAEEQGRDAGASPAACMVLAYLAINVEWRAKGELQARQIRRAQTEIAKKLTLNPRTVRTAVKRLRALGLIEDLDHNLRNVPHRYEVQLDWSFSRRLMTMPGFLPVAPATQAPAAPAVAAVEPTYPKLRKAGEGAINGQGGRCTVCQVDVPAGKGRIYKFQTHHLTFCAAHAMFGRDAAHHGWPENDKFPESDHEMRKLREGWVQGLTGNWRRAG